MRKTTPTSSNGDNEFARGCSSAGGSATQNVQAQAKHGTPQQASSPSGVAAGLQANYMFNQNMKASPSGGGASSNNNNAADAAQSKSVLEMGPQEIMALQMAQLARVRKVNAAHTSPSSNNNLVAVAQGVGGASSQVFSNIQQMAGANTTCQPQNSLHLQRKLQNIQDQNIYVATAMGKPSVSGSSPQPLSTVGAHSQQASLQQKRKGRSGKASSSMRGVTTTLADKEEGELSSDGECAELVGAALSSQQQPIVNSNAPISSSSQQPPHQRGSDEWDRVAGLLMSSNSNNMMASPGGPSYPSPGFMNNIDQQSNTGTLPPPSTSNQLNHQMIPPALGRHDKAQKDFSGNANHHLPAANVSGNAAAGSKQGKQSSFQQSTSQGHNHQQLAGKKRKRGAAAVNAGAAGSSDLDEQMQHYQQTMTQGGSAGTGKNSGENNVITNSGTAAVTSQADSAATNTSSSKLQTKQQKRQAQQAAKFGSSVPASSIAQASAPQNFTGNNNNGQQSRNNSHATGGNKQHKQQQSGAMGGDSAGFSKKEQLCKFALTGNCHRGNNCNFSHEFSLFPCKYLHGLGICKVNQCKFKHDRLNDQEIRRFMMENEEFLLKTLQETGQTNLNDYFIKYLDGKKRKQEEALVPKDVMMPPELLNKKVQPISQLDDTSKQQNQHTSSGDFTGLNQQPSTSGIQQDQRLQQQQFTQPPCQPAAVQQQLLPSNVMNSLAQFDMKGLLSTIQDQLAQQQLQQAQNTTAGGQQRPVNSSSTTTGGAATSASGNSAQINVAMLQQLIQAQQLFAAQQQQQQQQQLVQQNQTAMPAQQHSQAPQSSNEPAALQKSDKKPQQQQQQQKSQASSLQASPVGKNNSMIRNGSGSGQKTNEMTMAADMLSQKLYGLQVNPFNKSQIGAGAPSGTCTPQSPGSPGLHQHPSGGLMLSAVSALNNKLGGKPGGVAPPSSAGGSVATTSDPRLRPPSMASVNSQPKTRVEQDIENWKKQQMLMGNKGPTAGGQSSLNSLLYNNGSASGSNFGGGAQGNYGGGGSGGGQGNHAGGGVGGYGDSSNAAMARKKRRRKRSKSNRQRIKSFLSSSSGAEDQMNESMIESCSSPDYTQQEMELGKDFFFDLPPNSPQAGVVASNIQQQQQMLLQQTNNNTNIQANNNNSQQQISTPGNSTNQQPLPSSNLLLTVPPTTIMTPQQLVTSIEKLRQTLKETGHIIVLQQKDQKKPTSTLNASNVRVHGTLRNSSRKHSLQQPAAATSATKTI